MWSQILPRPRAGKRCWIHPPGILTFPEDWGWWEEPWGNFRELMAPRKRSIRNSLSSGISSNSSLLSKPEGIFWEEKLHRNLQPNISCWESQKDKWATFHGSCPKWYLHIQEFWEKGLRNTFRNMLLPALFINPKKNPIPDKTRPFQRQLLPAALLSTLTQKNPKSH